MYVHIHSNISNYWNLLIDQSAAIGYITFLPKDLTVNAIIKCPPSRSPISQLSFFHFFIRFTDIFHRFRCCHLFIYYFLYFFLIICVAFFVVQFPVVVVAIPPITHAHTHILRCFLKLRQRREVRVYRTIPHVRETEKKLIKKTRARQFLKVFVCGLFDNTRRQQRQQRQQRSVTTMNRWWRCDTTPTHYNTHCCYFIIIFPVWFGFFSFSTKGVVGVVYTGLSNYS